MAATHSRRYLGVHAGILTSEAVLMTSTGEVLARVEGGGGSPRRIGLNQAVATIGELFRRTLQAADLPADAPVHRICAIVADVDLPSERESVRDGLVRELGTVDVVVENDVHGLLWAGMRRPAGVALICGSGINAIARAATGRRAEYLSLGRVSGDWGGALELGREVLFAAQRSADGRGPRTRLQYEVAAFFHAPSVWDAIVSHHRSKSQEAELEALAGRLFEADAAADPVARDLVDRLVREVVGMITAAAKRTRMPSSGADIVLGGWVMTSGIERLDVGIDRAITSAMPGATVTRYQRPLVIGAALVCFGAERGGPLAAEGDAIADRIENAPLAPLEPTGRTPTGDLP